MKIIELLKKMFAKPDIYNGTARDDRSFDEIQANDIAFGSIVNDPQKVVWKEKSIDQCRSFPNLEINQRYTSSCVACSTALMLGIMYFLNEGEWLPFSFEDIYRRRKNRTEPGMIAYDTYDIASSGVVPKVFYDLHPERDPDIDNALPPKDFKTNVSKEFSIIRKVDLPIGNIDAIASVIQATGKGVMIWMYGSKNEMWQKIVEPKDIVNKATAEVRHSETAIDFIMYKGQKCLVTQDSADISTAYDGQRRIITEAFFKTRNYQASYPMNFKYAEDSNDLKPTYLGTIISLQKCLQYLGLFPSNIDFVESVGPVTRQGVIAFQNKYDISMTGNVGPITKAKLYELFP